MNENKKARKRNKDIASPAAVKNATRAGVNSNSSDVTGILDERIHNLREAEEVKRHLNMLQEPWATGFYPQVEFLRLSFHKSLTSRAKEQRTEQLKYWENGVNLAKERRKFLDEYKALVGMQRRLSENEDR